MAKVIIMPIPGNNENFKIKIQGKFGNKFIVKPKVYEVIQENNDTTIKLVNTFDKTILVSGFQIADFEVEGNTYANIEDLTQAISIAVFKKGGGGSGSTADETDPVFLASPSHAIDTSDVNFIKRKNYNDLNFLPDLSLKADLISGRVPISQLPSYKNEAGQIKVSYTGLSSINFSTNVEKQFDIAIATPIIATSPTTIYPFSTPKSYVGFFDSARNGGVAPFAGRLIENPKNGQPHVWRIIGTFNNKAGSNTGELRIGLKNPVSGFNVVNNFTLPGGITTGSFSVLLYTIADLASITSPNGYILTAQTSFADTDLNITINSITRFSNAIDN